MEILETIAIELVIALILELLRNTRITFDPFTFYTRLFVVGILIDAAGVHLEICEWQV